MLPSLKKLISQTFYYGISSIIGRMLHFLIIPVQTRTLSGQEIGLMAEIYSYIAVLNVLYNFCVDVPFFKFTKNNNINKSFTNFFFITFCSSSLLSLLLFFSSSKLISLIGHKQRAELVYISIAIIFFDSISTIPLAYLRYKNLAKKFMQIQILRIILLISFNIIILIVLDKIILDNNWTFVSKFLKGNYNPDKKIEYLLFGNLISSFIIFLLLIVKTWKIKFEFPLDLTLIKKILKFSFPIVLVGIFGVTNEMIIRISTKYLIPINSYENKEAIMGVFSSCFKLALFLNLAIQAFKFAAEPFFFSEVFKDDYKKKLAIVMHFFVIIMCFCMLIISLNLDLIAFIMLGPKFRTGIEIVPYAMLGYLFLGVYYNLSIWYKLKEKTYFAIFFTLSSFIISIILVFVFVPLIGYWGSIIAFLCSSFFMLVLCYYYGQKNYPIPYKIKLDTIYILLTFIVIIFFRNMLPLSISLRINIGILFTFILLTIIILKNYKTIYKLLLDNKTFQK